MKKVLLSFLMGMAFISFLGFSYANKNTYLPQNYTCEATQINGFFIFVDAKPVKKYRLIGVITSEELREKSSQQYTALRNKLILKAREQYEIGEADGLIFKFCDGCTDKVSVIKFDE